MPVLLQKSSETWGIRTRACQEGEWGTERGVPLSDVMPYPIREERYEAIQGAL